jgi:hypothetical protein
MKPGVGRQGPFLIATPPSGGKCTLATTDGTPVDGGAEVDVDDLKAA